MRFKTRDIEIWKSLLRIGVIVLQVAVGFPLHTAGAQTEHTLFRHGSHVRTVAYSPVNASLIASAGDAGDIKVWNIENDTVTTLGRHAGTVNAIAFSPDGRLLASGGDDYAFKLWNIPNRQQIASLVHMTDRGRSQVKAVAFSSDGRHLATAGVDVKIWDVRTREVIGTLEHDGWVFALAFSPDGQLLVTGDNAGQVNVWDVQRQQRLVQRQGDSEYIAAVAFSPNNRILASAGYDGQIKLWNVQTWERLGMLTSDGTIFNMSFSPDSSMLSGTGYESVNLWRVDTGETIATLTGHSGWVKAVAFSPDGNSLMSGGEDETLRLWNVTPYRSTTPDMVRVIYFLPRGRSMQPSIWAKLDTLIRNVQRFYADQMEINGFGRKTFTYETRDTGDLHVYRVDGKFRDQYYHTDTANKVYKEVAPLFDRGKHIYLIVADVSSELIGGDEKCGVGGGHWLEKELMVRTRGGHAVIPASGGCVEGAYGVVVAAHELGHAFGLEHDFRDAAYIMSYGAAPDRLSKCAASWLNAHRFFNTDQTAFDEPTTIQMVTPSTYLPNARNFALQFKVTDADGIHQAQLLVPTTAADPAPGVRVHSCKNLNTHSGTLEFSTPILSTRQTNEIALQVIDIHGNIRKQHYTLKAENPPLTRNNADVNKDGTVNIADLVFVASNFGKTIKGEVNRNPDVNRDGIVNVIDLLLVASLLPDASAAPGLHAQEWPALTTKDLQRWIQQAKNYSSQTDPLGLRPDAINKGIFVLEQLLATSVMPTETRLFANYPNPFNPETWIPYQLSEPTSVTLHIHSVKGDLVRTLAVGHRAAGVYHSKSRAAYWDGRNEQGERVASGVYFYTLTAGDFTATRKMLIQK